MEVGRVRGRERKGSRGRCGWRSLKTKLQLVSVLSQKQRAGVGGGNTQRLVYAGYC